MVRFVFLLCLIFIDSFAELELEDKKVLVRRKLGARDAILLATFRAESFEEKVLSSQLRNELKELLNTRRNIITILAEEIGEEKTERPAFEVLRANNIDYMITGNLVQDNNNFTFYLGIWEVYENKRLIFKKLTFKSGEEDIFLKQLASIIYEFITGEFGFFYGKLIYTLTERPGVIPFKKVVLSHVLKDVIQANTFSNGQDITFNPRYCKERSEMIYVNQARKGGNSFVITNVLTNKHGFLELPFEERKIIFSPNLSKDCNIVIFSIAENGATNLYSFNRELKEVTQLTKSKNAINTSASFFEEDSKIIFISDRTGKPRVWVMNKDGSNQKMLINGEGAYYSPSVSRDNKKIAFVKVRLGNFSLSIADINGENEKILYNGFVIENPVWTPIGKTIVFSMKPNPKAKSRIYAISALSGEIDELDALNGDLNEPKWIDEF